METGIIDLALVIDSTSKYSDVWTPYFGQLKKFFPKEIKKYLITDEMPFDVEIENLTPVYYDNAESYRNQFLKSLKQVKEKYMLYNSEDYILYNSVDIDEILALVELLEEDGLYDFVKLIKGPERTTEYSSNYPNVRVIDKGNNFFAQQASLWKTASLIDVFENSVPSNGRMEQEPQGSDVCKKIGINGLQYHIGTEVKRGSQHWDSIIFPCIATAVTKGKWNTREYGKELNEMFEEYGVKPETRGKNK